MKAAKECSTQHKGMLKRDVFVQAKRERRHRWRWMTVKKERKKERRRRSTPSHSVDVYSSKKIKWRWKPQWKRLITRNPLLLPLWQLASIIIIIIICAHGRYKKGKWTVYTNPLLLLLLPVAGKKEKKKEISKCAHRRMVMDHSYTPTERKDRVWLWNCRWFM